MSTSAFILFMENFPFRLFCDNFQKALSRVLEAPDPPESNEDAANCHRLRDFFLLKLFSVDYSILTNCHRLKEYFS